MKTMTQVTKVGDIMTKHVHTLDVNDSLPHAQTLFSNSGARHLPVLADGKLTGILSHTDIMRISFGDDFLENDTNSDQTLLSVLKIVDVMKEHPNTVDPDDTLTDVAEILTKEEYHALPVVEGETLVGIVTTTDVIRFLLEDYKSA